MKIYLLEGESFLVPGNVKQAHATLESMNVAAAALVNILREEVDLPEDATPEDWQAKCLEARQTRADESSVELDDLNEGDVWFTEMDLSGDIAPAGGYEGAFYEIARLLDIPAQTRSPKEVWESEMIPRLAAFINPLPHFAWDNDIRERLAKAMCENDGFGWEAASVQETGNGEEPEQQREYWRDKADAAITVLTTPPQTNVEGAKECECFGDSGLHASTYVPVGSDREHCDLCGHPVRENSADVLSAIAAASSSSENAKNYRAILDITKKTLEEYPEEHVIRHTDGRVIALCPLYKEPVCEGQFSFAPVVHRALNQDFYRMTWLLEFMDSSTVDPMAKA